MPAKSVIVQKSTRKKLLKLPLHVHKKILEALDHLQKDPLAGEKLHGELAGFYKYRVGDYRIVYIFDNKKSIVFVLKIEHRQGVYR